MARPTPDMRSKALNAAPFGCIPQCGDCEKTSKTLKTEINENMRTCILDGNNITDKETLHDIFTSSLQLPDWYGRNLDALCDCLSDIQEETEIRLLHEESLEDHLGHYAKALIKAISRVCQDNPRIHFRHST